MRLDLMKNTEGSEVHCNRGTESWETIHGRVELSDFTSDIVDLDTTMANNAER